MPAVARERQTTPPPKSCLTRVNPWAGIDPDPHIQGRAGDDLVAVSTRYAFEDVVDFDVVMVVRAGQCERKRAFAKQVRTLLLALLGSLLYLSVLGLR